MLDSLGLSRRTGGVQDVEHVLGVHLLGLAVHAGVLHEPVPPVIAPFFHLGECFITTGAGTTQHNYNVLD